MAAEQQVRNAFFKKHALAISLSLLFYPAAWAAPASNALPVLGNIASGTADVTRSISQGKLTVNQQSDQLIANWNSFNVGSNAQVIFNQPGTNSIALNRISSTAASQIFGQVTANGKLILVNPAGITIGNSGQISASSVIASSLNISDSDFNAGGLIFERGTATGAIDNQGSIQSLNGTTTLLAPTIKNSGILSAKNGNVNLANGNRLSSNGTTVTLSLASGIPALIQNTGTLQAERISSTNGRVYIIGDRYRTGSKVELAGTINASSSSIKAKQININGQLDSPNSLALDAVDSINVNGIVNISNANRLLSLTHGTKTGDGYYLNDTAKINLAGSGIGFRVNGDAYKVIHNINELQAIGARSGNLSGKYVLANDIDASTTAGWDSGKGFKPIGGNLPHNVNAPLFYFSGMFDGLGHSIDQLSINRGSQDYVGLFGAAKNASINNVRLNDVTINGDNYVAALVGYHLANSGLSSIQNNQVSGTIDGISNSEFKAGGIGSLIGYSKISNATVNINRNVSDSHVSGGLFTGGLLGRSNVSDSGVLNIKDNQVAGSVWAVSLAGGLLASNDVDGGSVTIKNNITSASVNSYNMLEEDFPGKFGGLIGNHHVFDGRRSNASTVTIENNQVSGNVNAANVYTGGLIGSNFTATYGTFNLTGNRVSGQVTGSAQDNDDDRTSDGDAKGGLIGSNTLVSGNMNINNNLVNASVIGAGSYTGGLIGLNISWGNLNISNSHISGNVTGGRYVGGLIGHSQVSFAGKLNITKSSSSADITGQQYSGGLLGQSRLNDGSATLQSSYSKGSVNGDGAVGGLIGFSQVLQGNLLLANTYSSATVTATNEHAGGLIGANATATGATSRIFNSYANGHISGSNATGGLIGYSEGTGNLRVDRSFWDMGSTSQPASIGGTGLSSEQMKQLSTYAGWNINSNPAGSSIWYINEGVAAPTLRQ